MRSPSSAGGRPETGSAASVTPMLVPLVARRRTCAAPVTAPTPVASSAFDRRAAGEAA